VFLLVEAGQQIAEDGSTVHELADTVVTKGKEIQTASVPNYLLDVYLITFYLLFT
jgi:hypothetical protein